LELVYREDLKSSVERRVGASPTGGTNLLRKTHLNEVALHLFAKFQAVLRLLLHGVVVLCQHAHNLLREWSSLRNSLASLVKLVLNQDRGVTLARFFAPRCKVHGFPDKEYNRRIAVLGCAIQHGATTLEPLSLPDKQR